MHTTQNWRLNKMTFSPVGTSEQLLYIVINCFLGCNDQDAVSFVECLRFAKMTSESDVVKYGNE